MFVLCSNLSFLQKDEHVILHRLQIQAFVFEGCCLLVLEPANDGKLPRDFDRTAEKSVRVWKGGFMVDKISILVPMSYSKLSKAPKV